MNCYYLDSYVCRCTERECDMLDNQSLCGTYEPECILKPYTRREIAIDALHGIALVSMVVFIVIIISCLIRGYFV